MVIRGVGHSRGSQYYPTGVHKNVMTVWLVLDTEYTPLKE